ncbi:MULTISPECIES: AraC family transcriptional regulator [unclassified Acidovorax]|uniref:AraC family transcriptional regulator n=1 Tax=unclassified Acidovorax TaxID=2684926 RepID=UPI000C19B37A|nr:MULTISPECIES: AraC family transcriptional regulator [unclassified Acidovorax]PIF16784.1 AraC family transcriptional regulator [Acidovorax sp. 59]PKW04191.1 AraC-like DNA-binding protein [Acidovorax sp. 30]
MIDPLSEVVALLQPAARLSKQVNGSGQWRIRRSDLGDPFYCVVLEGSCCLSLDGKPQILLESGDFVLIPAAYGIVMTSADPPADDVISVPAFVDEGVFAVGQPNGAADLCLLVGHCTFDSPDAALLVSLLPEVVYTHGDERLAALVQFVGDETRQQRPARAAVLARLLELLFIEALRSTSGSNSSLGLVGALSDPRIAPALRAMHEYPAKSWTVTEMAREAALSRSAFFERFSRIFGMPPMKYLLALRMAIAKDLLRRGTPSVAEIAERVGFRSASTFSIAFARHVGLAPTHFARALQIGGGDEPRDRTTVV